MKRLILPIICLLILSSCMTAADERAERYIAKGERLTGAQAADVYDDAAAEIGTPSLYYNLAYSYLEDGDYESAVETADEAIALFPDMLRFMYLKAYALRESGRYLSYERMLHSILAFDPGNDDIRQLLLDHYLDTGRRSDAAAVGRDMIARDSDNSSALTALGFISDFFAAIAPSRSNGFKPEGRLWSEPPFIYQNLGILRGERLLRDVKREITPPPLSSSTP